MHVGYFAINTQRTKIYSKAPLFQPCLGEGTTVSRLFPSFLAGSIAGLGKCDNDAISTLVQKLFFVPKHCQFTAYKTTTDASAGFLFPQIRQALMKQLRAWENILSFLKMNFLLLSRQAYRLFG